MSTQVKPIKVYGKGGPNPQKVVIFLKALGVPYEFDSLEMSEVKSPGYVAINPNGRLPTIQDPNTGITLWESGAIVEYLADRYDKDNKLSFTNDTPESYHAKQWLFFQATGQGPYYGQMVWFKKYHGEQIPSAVERYVKEVNRVTSVLESHLSKQKEQHSGGDGPWLVGNKYSYADISFIPWQRIAGMFLDKESYDTSQYPLVTEWLGKMLARESTKEAFKEFDH